MCKFVLITAIAMCAVSACKEERDVRVEELYGTWEVTAAEREGRETETLNGAIFDIGEGGQMYTNIMNGRDDTGTYTFKEMTLHFDGNEPAVYEIDSIGADRMHLSVKLQGMDFSLSLERTAAE